MTAVRLPEPARVSYAVRASGGHKVRLRISSKEVDVSLASACSFYVVFGDLSTATWTTTLTADPASPAFVLDSVASSIYAAHTIVTGDLVTAQIGDATVDAVITVSGQAHECDQRILTVTP